MWYIITAIVAFSAGFIACAIWTAAHGDSIEEEVEFKHDYKLQDPPRRISHAELVQKEVEVINKNKEQQ